MPKAKGAATETQEAPKKRGRKPKAEQAAVAKAAAMSAEAKADAGAALAAEVAAEVAAEQAPAAPAEPEQPQEPVTLNGTMLARLVELEQSRADLEAMLEAVKEERKRLETELLKQFEATGTSSVKAKGVTIYLRRDLWAKLAEGVDRKRAIVALKAAGLDDMVAENFNTNTLSSYMRELEKNGDPLPEAFAGVFESSEVYSLRTTGAK